MSEMDRDFIVNLVVRAHTAETHSSDANDVAAFLTRYGSAADIRAELDRVEQLRGFFTKHIGEAYASKTTDHEALVALDVVADRLRGLHARAEQYHWLMDLLGWKYDGTTMKYAPPNHPGRKKTLEAMTIAALFARLTAGGMPRSNTKEMRDRIRAEMLRHGTHPDVVTDKKIENAINIVLNPARHY
jgi:hypothetical protein